MRAVRGLAIYPDKDVEEVELSSLEDYQAIVGGLIYPVMLKDGSSLYVNEESAGLRFNSIATDVAGLGGNTRAMLQGLVGPAVLVGPITRAGRDTDVTDRARRWVRRVAREARP